MCSHWFILSPGRQSLIRSSRGVGQDAVSQIFSDKTQAGQEAKAKQAYSSLDQVQNRQQDKVQRQEKALEEDKARVLVSMAHLVDLELLKAPLEILEEVSCRVVSRRNSFGTVGSSSWSCWRWQMLQWEGNGTSCDIWDLAVIRKLVNWLTMSPRTLLERQLD